MPTPAPVAAAATILLHALLIVAVVRGLTAKPEPDTRSEPVQVQLLRPEPPPVPVAPPAPHVPAPAPAPVKKARPTPKPAPIPKPAPSVAAPSPAPAQTTSQDTKPAPAAGPPASAPAPAAPPAAPAPPAPVRTSASEASYAATNRTPPYPRISLNNGDEGTVVLRVLVTAEGTAGAVEIKSSSGHTLLDESARKTVMSWRFKPATIDGKPVAEWYQVPIPFKLQNN